MMCALNINGVWGLKIQRDELTTGLDALVHATLRFCLREQLSS